MGSTDTDSGDTVPKAGETRTVSRTFTREDVEAFATLSRDTGDHHLEPDDEGRLVLHGLLLALLPTELGGERNVLARTMEYEFHRPAYTGEAITCAVTTDRVEDRGDRYYLESSAECTNPDGQTVMTASYEGAIVQ